MNIESIIGEGIMNKLLIDLIPFPKLRKSLKNKYFPKDFSMEKMKHCLMIAPHPDDETLGAGGLLLKYHDKFDCICMASSGVQTPWISARDRADLRLKEFEVVMDAVGISKRWIFNTFGVPPMNDQIWAYFHDYCSVLETEKYDCFFLPHPDDNHEEHRFITNKLFKRILKKNGYRPEAKVVFYEVWAPLMHPNYFEDISEVAQDKERILKLYASQLSSSCSIISHIMGLNAYRGIFPKTQYAEAFRVCSVQKYLRGSK